MATFRANARRFVGGGGAGAVLASILLASCGQLTGLSDDYRFDLDAGAPSSTTGPDGARIVGDAAGSTVDGRAGDGASGTDAAHPPCSAADRVTATNDLAQADLVPSACKSCLASSCCTEIETCASRSECDTAMKCVFQCQKNGGGNARTVCLDNCKAATFFQTVGSCISSSCSSCQLQ
jgi:hypothetical protein